MLDFVDHSSDEGVNEYVCSNCNCYFSIGWIFVKDEVNPTSGYRDGRIIERPLYCPNCGAKEQ